MIIKKREEPVCIQDRTEHIHSVKRDACPRRIGLWYRCCRTEVFIQQRFKPARQKSVWCEKCCHEMKFIAQIEDECPDAR